MRAEKRFKTEWKEKENVGKVVRPLLIESLSSFERGSDKIPDLLSTNRNRWWIRLFVIFLEMFAIINVNDATSALRSCFINIFRTQKWTEPNRKCEFIQKQIWYLKEKKKTNRIFLNSSFFSLQVLGRIWSHVFRPGVIRCALASPRRFDEFWASISPVGRKPILVWKMLGIPVF